MPVARRVLLAPPGAWDEDRLLDAARGLPGDAGPLRPGDALGDLVVLGVEPAPGDAPDASTVFDLAPAPRPASAPLVDVAVLLDVAESMGLPWGADLTRSEAAREALFSFLAGPGAGVGDVSVLTYARDARLVVPPTPRGALSAFDVPAPSGPARTGAALDAALVHLAARGRPDRVQAILLLTDGAGDEKPAQAAAARAARLGVPVHALVFAPEADPLLQDVARATRGSAQVATLPLTIDFVHQPGSDAS
jgi:hypothetical protein